MIELEISGDRIEYAHGLAARMQQERNQGFADQGYRAALSRDPRMLKAMERAVEHIDKLAESQRGESRRAAKMTGSNYGESVEFTELALWREAYRMMDKGTPLQNFEWIYGAGAWLAGLIIR